MQLYEVNYSVGNSSLTQYLRTQVQALGPSQATAMVEAMNGGSSNCTVHYARPIFG